MDSDDSSESLFKHKEYDVTNNCANLCCCCLMKATVTLEPEEAVYEAKNCFEKSTKRLPYGELGSVQHNQACGCCHSFVSNLSGTDDKGNLTPMVPGWGCDAELVSEIVEELKARMKGRGDTGNIQRAEDAIKMIKVLNAKVDAIMQRMSVPPVQRAMDEPVAEKFDHVEFEVTECCLKNFCCGKKMLNLDPEEAVLHTTTCISSTAQRRPYGELGYVDKITQCGCCHAVTSGLGMMSPDYGCSDDVVDEIVVELKRRMKARGDTGNIQRQEQTIQMIKHQDLKINAILQQMGLPIPVAPSQKVMG